jgi:hypothetical protein
VSIQKRRLSPDFGVSAMLFAATGAVTIFWCASMSAMSEIPMPDGWTILIARAAVFG